MEQLVRSRSQLGKELNRHTLTPTISLAYQQVVLSIGGALDEAGKRLKPPMN